MRKTNLSFLAVVLLLGTSAAAGAGPDVGDAPRIYLCDLPQELNSQVRERLDDCKKSFAVTDAAATQVRDLLTEFDLDKPTTMKLLRDGLKEKGPGSILVIDEFLVSHDASTREKAVFALRCLIDNDENAPKEGSPTDSLLTALFRRSVLDASAKVRRSCMIGLRSIASVRSGSVRTDAIAALRNACDDPDPDLRRFAEQCAKAVEPAMAGPDGD